MEEKSTAKDVRRIVWKIRFDRLRKWFGSKTGFTGKTLWDWFGLLIVPAVLGFGALWFNQAMRTNEQIIAADRQREETLQNYFDKMAELLLQDNLREADLRETVLFDANLSRAWLLETNLSEAWLSRADLRGAMLAGAWLSSTEMLDVDLSDANLTGAHMRGAILRAANLSGANPRGADLSEADLRFADLSGTDLSMSNLTGSNLRWADLSTANLTEADLTGARYNSQTKWPEGFDYENSGAILDE